MGTKTRGRFVGKINNERGVRSMEESDVGSIVEEAQIRSNLRK